MFGSWEASIHREAILQGLMLKELLIFFCQRVLYSCKKKGTIILEKILVRYLNDINQEYCRRFRVLAGIV